jgi:glycosyltransferase involved in cell wall biosynthesis
MKILFLSNWFPYPPSNGSKLRIYNLLRGLAQSHEVTLISFADELELESGIKELESICKGVHVISRKTYDPRSFQARLGFLSSTPRSIRDTFSAEMAECIRILQDREDFDLVIASQVGTAVYRQYFNQTPAIFEEVETGVLYENYARADAAYQRFRHGLTWSKHRRFLTRVIKGFNASTVASRQEKLLISDMLPGYRSIEVIPNCINLADYDRVHAMPKPGSLIFCGSFRYHANYDSMLWFLGDILPLIQTQVPDMNLTITGDHAGLQLPTSDHVILTGFVEDVRPLIASAWISLAPLRVGGGTRLKILEAMALKTPVVATSKGAEGLDVKNGSDILIADTPQEFAEAVIRLTKENSLRQLLVENAYRLVLEKYNWPIVMPRFLELVQKTVQS